MLFYLALAGLGFFAYNEHQKKVAGNQAPIPHPSQMQQPQPSQQYPMKPAPQVRADNSNQPWSSSSGFMQKLGPWIGGPSQDLQNTAAGVSIASGAADLWKTLDIGSWFSSGGDDTSEADAAWDDEDSYDIDWSSNDYESDSMSGWDDSGWGSSYTEYV